MSDRLLKEVQRLKDAGVSLPRNPRQAAQAANDMGNMSRYAQSQLGMSYTGLGKTVNEDTYRSSGGSTRDIIQNNMQMTRQMGQSRLAAKRQSSMGSGDVAAAVPRFYDPLEYWDITGLPWNVANEGHRHKLHKWLRLYYATHYLIPILVDIFTRFPLVGLELESNDHQLQSFYEDLFIGQLDYPEFLVHVGREFWLCALPGELVQTGSGVQSIEKVKTGDRVLTHKGNIKPVSNPFSREYDGGAVKLCPHYGLPMSYTYGHPFWVRHGAPSKRANRDEYLQARNLRYSQGVPDVVGKSLSAAEWVPIEEITKDDYVFVPVDNRERDRDHISVWETLSKDDWVPVPSLREVDDFTIPEYVKWTTSPGRYRSYIKRAVSKIHDKGCVPGDVWKKNILYGQHSALPSKLDLNEDLLWFLGLYLAEGSVTKDGVRIDLHIKEQEYAERVMNFADSLGLNSTARPAGDNGLKVAIYSISFGAWVQSLLGTGWYGKRLPEWIMILPKEKISFILRGFFDGDGCYSTDSLDPRVKATSGSKDLALQVERLIRRLGVVTTINSSKSITKKGTHCEWWDVGPCKADMNLFARFIGIPEVYPVRDRAFAVWGENGYWVRVFKLDHIEYKGPVYNFEVEDDHSYVGSVATHNCGEAFPLGSFDEGLGVWEREELLIPENVVIENFNLLGTQQFKVACPEDLKKLVQTKSPPREWRMLELNYPELIPYLKKGEPFPVANTMLKQVANKLTEWDDHGTPILLRGLRTLLHEEKLAASQEAIAERLYSPLILAKAGIVDFGDGQPPWIPGPDELDAIRDDFDIALASDFRLIVHNVGLEVSNVFGREQMPRLGDDFDRIERRLMQVFGVNPSLLSAGANSQPYASSALQAEFLNQILKTFQNRLKKHFRERALIVAEAQGHYEYETKGQTRIPVMEHVVELREDGTQTIVEKPKLKIPEMTFASLDLRDEATERQFLQTLRTMGVPIPDNKLMVGIPWDLADMDAEYNTELKRKTIAQQQAKMDTYTALKAKGLPIPGDLKAEVEAVLGESPPAGGGAPPGGAGGGPPPMGGAPGGGPPTGPEGGGGGGGPSGGPGGGIVMPPAPPGAGGAGGMGPGGAGGTPPGGGPPPTSPNASTRGTVPESSNERRPGLRYNTSTGGEAEDVISSRELVLSRNQELLDEGGEKERILEKGPRKVQYISKANQEKKYSIIDPDAPELEDDEPKENEC